MPFGENAQICSKCGEAFKTGDCIELPPVCWSCKRKEADEDWYDKGPGSEHFKRQIRQSTLEFHKHNAFFPRALGQKKIKQKKNGKNLGEMLEALSWRLKEDVKLSPHTVMPKGLLEETVKIGRRLLRYVEELEK